METTLKCRTISIPPHGPDRQNHRLLSLFDVDDPKFVHGDHKVRVRIQLDKSYNSQSNLVAEVWCSGQGWREVASLLWTEINGEGKEELLRLEALLLEQARWALEKRGSTR